jgi:hypothetical protein
MCDAILLFKRYATDILFISDLDSKYAIHDSALKSAEDMILHSASSVITDQILYHSVSKDDIMFSTVFNKPIESLTQAELVWHFHIVLCSNSAGYIDGLDCIIRTSILPEYEYARLVCLVREHEGILLTFKNSWNKIHN